MLKLSKSQLSTEFNWTYEKLKKERLNRIDDFKYENFGLDFSSFITKKSNANKRLHHYYRHIDRIMKGLSCV